MWPITLSLLASDSAIHQQLTQRCCHILQGLFLHSQTCTWPFLAKCAPGNNTIQAVEKAFGKNLVVECLQVAAPQLWMFQGNGTYSVFQNLCASVMKCSTPLLRHGAPTLKHASLPVIVKPSFILCWRSAPLTNLECCFRLSKSTEQPCSSHACCNATV